ncbi:hypothetical protein M9H77_17923 [Catharanthus roseus]|uniref:Uncharacterized protein n=1 Tax=Catharanthus roseus TaxID=4058 RepID=A0ACC0B608_CATRO|nr:hypothetical protein M9H77_17923 [Catharanthus roseus]
MKKKQLLWIKEKNLEKNGGKILKEKQKGSSVIVRTFTAEELKKATNNYHKSTIIGQGGNGIVYSGRLKEKKEVAIKKSRTVDHDQIDQFINENVVELLGCCLEDEVPLLVYEFISNGTLYQHLHKKNDANYVLKWDVRLRIAAETANALSYLHSAASPPIIHRDVKTAYILLDENWTAKVADFGASRLVPLNESQISTMVLGTFGYLDPEYFQTGQLTGKSDVYSFGVVLVELLTGKLPVSYDRPENERSLANLFLSSLKQNNLVEILDPNISFSEVQIEVAMLAKRCLNVKGEDRPTMEEVSTELKGLLKANHCPIPDANWNSEEIQSVEDALISVDSLMATTSTFSVEKQNIILPLLGDGR